MIYVKTFEFRTAFAALGNYDVYCVANYFNFRSLDRGHFAVGADSYCFFRFKNCFFAFNVVNEGNLFGIFVIMSAGTGALCEQFFSLPFWVGSLVICAITALLAIKGVGAMVKVFSFFVPVLVAVTLGISAYSLIKYGFPEISFVKSGENPLLSNWLVSAFTFVSYNIFLLV